MLLWVGPRRSCIWIIYFHNDIDNIILATQVHSFREERLQTAHGLTVWNNDANENVSVSDKSIQHANDSK